MSANFSTDLKGPSEGGGAAYATISTLSQDASPVALRFFHVMSGFRNETSAYGAELRSLLSEADPEIFHRGILQEAARQERRGRIAEAAALYQALSQVPAGKASELAQRRLAALNGGGQIGDQAEQLLSRFVREIGEPAPLLAMGAAGLAFRAARGGALANLLLRPSGAFTRGIGARFLASSVGFGAEVLAFSGTNRAVNAAMGRQLDWSSVALKNELAQSLLFLGAVKGAGALAQSMQRSLGKGTARAAFLGQATLLGGIYAGGTLEEMAGLRPARSAETSLVDSLALFLNLKVAGRLSQALLGSRFGAWERELDLRSSFMAEQGASPGALALKLGGLVPSQGPSNLQAGEASPRKVYMASGSGSRGDLPPLPPLRLPRPTSSFPPRSSDFFPSRAPGIVKVNPPPEHIGEILDLLLPHRTILPDALNKAARQMDWLMPDERCLVIRWALESVPPEILIERLGALATETKNRGAAVHALRLLLLLQVGDRPATAPLMNNALQQIGTVMSPDPQWAGGVRWKVGESRMLHALDSIFAAQGQPQRKSLVFELELVRLARGGFLERYFDDLLYFSLELNNPKTRDLLANSAVSMGLQASTGHGPLRDFMTWYYVIGRLAETGHLKQAAEAANLAEIGTQYWSGTAFPRQYQDFLRRRLKFQQNVVDQYSEILRDAQPEALQNYYQLQAASGNLHLPETWGVIWKLREKASALRTPRGDLTMSAMVPLQAAQELMRNNVLDPITSKALQASPALRPIRQQILELAEDLPVKARIESQEPLQVLFNALTTRGDWKESYRLLDSLYHLQFADPMVLRQLHASVLMGLDVAQHRAVGTSEYEVLAAHLKHFQDFESRFF